MPLHFDAPPKYVRAAAARAARRALHTRRGGKLREPVKLTPGIAVHTAPMTRLAHGWLAKSQRIGWRFYLVDADARSISIEIGVHEGRAHISHLAYGPPVRKLLLAIGALDTHAPVGARLRFVRIGELSFFGAWLHTARSDELHEFRGGRFAQRELEQLTDHLQRFGAERARAHRRPPKRREKKTAMARRRGASK